MASTGEVAKLLTESDNTVLLTGAGVSRASGLPVFRGAGGLWGDEESGRWAYRDNFDADPADWYEAFWKFYNMRRGLEPSAGHVAIRDMVEASVIDMLVTQNVDGFDRMAGTPEEKMLEIHGHDRSLSCANMEEQGCDYNVSMGDWLEANDQSVLPRCPEDGDVLKPDIMLINDWHTPEHVWTPYDRAGKVLAGADTLVVAGSSLPIRPWYEAAIRAGQDEDRSLVVINPQATRADYYAQMIVRGMAEEALPALRDLTVQ
jgi:NAD-dependent deacetylase